ncbi:MAG TPA: hypothetical protein VIJ82_01295 [Streptosporangiaceae bacterium]
MTIKQEQAPRGHRPAQVSPFCRPLAAGRHGSPAPAAVFQAAGTGRQLIRAGGQTAERGHLAGKPAPDMVSAAARAPGVAPAEAAVSEDALAGAAAGRGGGSGFVAGTGRAGQASELQAQGADVMAGLAGLPVVS